MRSAPSTIAARLSSAISSDDFTSRVSIPAGRPDLDAGLLQPNIIGGSVMSADGILATPAAFGSGHFLGVVLHQANAGSTFAAQADKVGEAFSSFSHGE
jgi:hypothetical protein